MDAGRYRLLEQIGTGGMAEVFDAVAIGDAGFERRVAIKRMRAASGADRAASELAQRRFLDEARIASQLHHANIVAVVDYGTADGQPFQVLEHVDGLDGHELIARASGAIPIEVALHIAASVGHALVYAHDAVGADGQPLGIVHRDVTPGNVMIAWSGDVKLTDFGIAFAFQRADKTRAGTTKGTPRFMAPEQLLGGDIDRRTDLFALGCLLHALVTGASPLTHDDELLRRGAGTELELTSALPQDVRAIVARCTRYQRRDRYANAGELVAALAAALAARRVIDPRARLCEWLRAVNPDAETLKAPPPRGKLDALLDVELVLAGGGGARTFTTKMSSPPPPAPVSMPVLVPVPVLPPPPPRRRFLPLVIASILALAAAAALIAWLSLSNRTTQTPVATPIDAAITLEPSDSPDVYVNWASNHPQAVPEFDAWRHAHDAAARALFLWAETHPTGIAELVTWAQNHDAPLATFLAGHAFPELAALASAHPGDYDGFLAWARKHRPAATTLAHRPRALGALARQSDP